MEPKFLYQISNEIEENYNDIEGVRYILCKISYYYENHSIKKIDNKDFKKMLKLINLNWSQFFK